LLSKKKEKKERDNGGSFKLATVPCEGGGGLALKITERKERQGNDWGKGSTRTATLGEKRVQVAESSANLFFFFHKLGRGKIFSQTSLVGDETNQSCYMACQSTERKKNFKLFKKMPMCKLRKVCGDEARSTPILTEEVYGQSFKIAGI